MHVDWAEAEDGDDGRLGLVGWHAVVVWGARGALHIATRPDRYCILRLEIAGGRVDHAANERNNP